MGEILDLTPGGERRPITTIVRSPLATNVATAEILLHFLAEHVRKEKTS